MKRTFIFLAGFLETLVASAQIPSPGDGCGSADEETSWRTYRYSYPKAIGTYDVSFTLGGERAERAWIRFEGRRVAAGEIVTRAGETTNVMVTVRVKGPVTSGEGPKGSLEARFPETLDLSVVSTGARPADPIVTPNESARTIWLCGDSTVADQEKEPWGSWGGCLPQWFDRGIAVVNYARSALTTETFLKQGRLGRICSFAKKGDLVLVQFGHNDQTRKNLSPAPGGGYEKNLNRFIDEIRATGATPILVTPVERHRFADGMQLERTLAAQADAVRRVGQARDVAVIDLSEASWRLYAARGESGAEALFAKAKEEPDRTHHNIPGASLLSRFIANEIVRLAPTYAPFLRAPGRGFDPSNPPPLVAIPPCGKRDKTRPLGDDANTR